MAYQNDCFLHHHGPQLPDAVMASWPSSSRFGSSQLPRNHLHVAVLILHLRATHMRPSTLQAFEVWGSSRNHLKYRLLCIAAEKMNWSATDALRLSGLTLFQTRHDGANIDRVQVLGTLASWQRQQIIQLLVLTGIRQDVSAGTCVAAVISPTSNTVRFLPQLFPSVLPSKTCFIVLACRGFWNIV